MSVCDSLLNYLVGFHAQHGAHASESESRLKKFCSACVTYMTTPVADDDAAAKLAALNKVKQLGMEMTKEMASQMWYPLAKCCDVETYWNVSDPEWTDEQMKSITSSGDDSKLTQTAFCNLARIALTYCCDDERGVKCSDKLRDSLFA